MRDHISYPYAGDQNDGQQMPLPPSSAMPAECSSYWSPSAAYLAMPTTSAGVYSQTTSSQASPQLQMIPTVAPINDKRPPFGDAGFVDNSPSSGVFYSSKVTNNDDCAIFALNQDSSVMEHKVRQFCSADGTSFIEHVPGHCLVFIPNTTNVDYVLRELRKIRQPKPKPKPRDRSPKPTNAFIKYRNHKIDDLKSMHPDISQTEISRMAGECWKTEPLEVKTMFQRKYQEEKRIYDMNKAKRARTDSDAGSDAEAHSDAQSTSSTVHAHSSPSLRTVPQDVNAGMGLGLSGSVGPAGFNTGRRRSHTLPPGGFSRSGTKRRISQELRKHLASKSNNAYMAAAAGNGGSGFFGSAQPPPPSMQPFPSQYEFTFTSPQPEMSVATTACMDSPGSYLACDVSPMLMPLNPNFPIAEFAGTVPQNPSQGTHQHTRSLSNIPAGLMVDTSVFATGMPRGFESYEHTAIHSSLTTSLAESQISIGLPMVGTSSLGSYSAAVDTMPINAFAASYLSADIATPMSSAANPWPMQHAYTMVPDNNPLSGHRTLH
ncbi:hypothetical protein H4R26_004761 [Coemansia thaxteri]|uniref:HMG box domain-containing protein n=1 Tax=Coemansia thaxteri TaxID=2663907 RepID=A0A9W8BA18_9FUNG|nr:hypothetical protein H4R26_004761 [Coemansia thaxteri]